VENTWLHFAKQLHSIATTGLELTKGGYDRERYQVISDIALRMLADLGNVPLTRIADLVSDHAVGYMTPKVDVRAAVLNEDGILLVREKADGLWALPGGFADVGLSPAENAEKEVREEAGIDVKASYLYSVRHKAKGQYGPDIRDFYKFFFLCSPVDEQTPSPGSETLDVGYFGRDSIPELSTDRVVIDDLLAAWELCESTSRRATFD